MKVRAFTRRMVVALSLILMTAGVLAAPSVYQLGVDGLACPFCAYGVEKKLNAIEGVEHLETNIKEGTVMVTMKDGITLDETMVRTAVKDAGFTLKVFKQVAPNEPQ